MCARISDFDIRMKEMIICTFECIDLCPRIFKKLYVLKNKQKVLNKVWECILQTNKPDHRSDSMWGTDYIANPFFLN